MDNSSLWDTPELGMQEAETQKAVTNGSWDTGLFVAIVVTAIVLISMYTLCVHWMTRCEPKKIPSTRVERERRNSGHTPVWFRMYDRK